MNTTEPEVHELSDILGVLRRRAGTIIAAVILVAGGAFALSLSRPKVYTASAVLLFDSSDGVDQHLFGASTPSTASPEQQAATNLQLVSLPVVAVLTAKALGNGATAASVTKLVRVTQPQNSNTVSVSATGPTPQAAVHVASVMAEQFVRYRRGAGRQEITRAMAAVRGQILQLASAGAGPTRLAGLRSKYLQLGLMASVSTSGVTLAQAATPPTGPSSPRPVRDAAIGAFAGLLLGLLLAFVRDQLDRRLRAPEDFASALGAGVPVLMELSRDAALTGNPLTDPDRSQALGPFALLHARLQAMPGAAGARTLLVTSAAPGSGNTTVAVHLALAAAAADERVLLIDADLRSGSVGALLECPGAPGLSELVSERSGDPAKYVRHFGEREPVGPPPNGSTNGNGHHPTDPDPNLARVLELARAELCGRGHGAAVGPPPVTEPVLAQAAARLAATVLRVEQGLPARRPEHAPIDVVFAGAQPAPAVGALVARGILELLGALDGAYDLVVIDAPPVALVADCVPLLTHVDGVLVVGRLPHDAPDDVRQLGDLLRQLEVAPLGVVASSAAAGQLRDADLDA